MDYRTPEERKVEEAGGCIGEAQLPICADHAEAWYTGRDRLATINCVVCAFYREVVHHGGVNWYWVGSGDGMYLVSDETRHRPVILISGEGPHSMMTRDDKGMLELLTRDHPVAKRIAAIPRMMDLLAAAARGESIKIKASELLSELG